MDTMLVRIKPRNNRDQHVILFGGQSFPITKERGWCRVPKAVAEIAKAEVMNDLNPDSPLVFDVKDEEGAKAIAEAEIIRVEPAGTPEKPHVVKPQTIDAGVEPQSPAAKKGRRGQ